MLPRPLPLALTAVVLLSVCGCKKNTTITLQGTVTYNGYYIEKGFITFYPAEGSDSTRGGDIVDGEFKVVNLTPGRKRVLITVHPEAKVREGGGGTRLQFLPPSIKITPQTPGNNQIVEVVAGQTAMDFALGKP